MKLGQTSILSAVAVGVKTAVALILNKILALIVGPSGYAIIGQFQNFISVVFTLGSGAIATGVTKYTAQYHDDPFSKRDLWRSAAAISTVVGTIFALCIALSSPFLAKIILHDARYWDVFIWLAGSLVFLIWNALLLALMNGERQIGRYVTAQITGNIIALAVVGALAQTAGLRGALIALTISQSLGFIATLALCWHQPWFVKSNFLGRFDRSMLRKLGAFAAMTVSAALSVPVAQMIVRDSLVSQFGWTYAGYWDGMQRISATYLSFAVAVLNTYYIPRISAINDSETIRSEAIRLAALCAGFSILSAVAIYSLRGTIIHVLLDESFMPMTDLFAWQAVGDIFRILSAVLSMILVAKALVIRFIILQGILIITFPIFNIALTKAFGFEASSMAYAATYALYLGICLLLVVQTRILSPSAP